MINRFGVATLALVSFGTLFGPAASARDRDGDERGYYGSTHEYRDSGRAYSHEEHERMEHARDRNSYPAHNYGYQNNPFYNNGYYNAPSTYYGGYRGTYSRRTDTWSGNRHDRDRDGR